jgi:hypothetical protein
LPAEAANAATTAEGNETPAAAEPAQPEAAQPEAAQPEATESAEGGDA